MRVFNIAILFIMLISGCSQPDIATETKSNNVEVRTKDTLIMRDSVVQKVTTNIHQFGDTIIIDRYVYERQTTDRTAASGRDTFYIQSDTITKYVPMDIKGNFQHGSWVLLLILVACFGLILLFKNKQKD